MAIRNIKRWQWILASLIVGVALAYFQQLPTENWQKRFGDTITQKQFEEALTREQSGLRWFKDIVIYPEQIDAGGKAMPVSIVSGNYFGGKLELQNGKPAAVWRPRCYVVEGAYQPLAPGGIARASDTIFAYLQSAKDVKFVYAWWRDPKWATSMWLGGSFLLIGIMWPTAINLIVFGSIMRPNEARGIDLSKSPAPGTGAKVNDADLAAVAEMGDDMEAALVHDSGTKSAAVDAAAETAPACKLTAAAALDAAAEQAHDKKDFGRDKDDFYPTEVHKPH